MTETFVLLFQKSFFKFVCLEPYKSLEHLQILVILSNSKSQVRVQVTVLKSD